MGFRENRDDTLLLKFEDDSEYHGAEIRCRRRVPTAVYLSVEALTEGGRLADAIEEFGSEVLLEWNVEDSDSGEPLSADGEGLKRISPQFAGEIISQWAKAVTDVPKASTAPSVNGRSLAAVSMPLGE